MGLDSILAKSDGTTLLKHTNDVLRVFKSIKESYPNIPEVCNVDNFWEILFVSLFLHDVGKTASGFQKSLIEGGAWGYRHEILSASCVSLLEGYDKFEKTAIALSIIGHHKSLDYIKARYATFPEGPGSKHYEKRINELMENTVELNQFLSHITKLSEKYLGKKLRNPLPLKSEMGLIDSYKEFILPNYLIPWEDGEKSVLHGLYGYYLKGFMTACDHLASGSRYTVLNGLKNLRKVYDFPSYMDTQKKAMNTKGDVLLTAPTGSGKTEAALFWSENNQNKQHSRRVFYLLPYTASINAMYERLVHDFRSEELIGLLHGKANYYIYKTLVEDIDNIKAASTAKNIRNLTKKIYRPYKIMTPFQVLKPFFGVKGFEQQLSEMTNGLFILDEIHAYDPHTTALIIEMLKILKERFNANILIMSATVPSFLKDILKNELKIKKEIGLNKKELEKFTRHKINILPGNITEYYELIVRDIQNGKRVLVVCNTVKRSQEVFKELSKKCESSALIHSRFILKDREEIEKKLGSLDLLVGTQAIEVSLDISYDVLYTEPAPMDALIQRLGRINRRGWEKGVIAPAYIFEEGADNDRYIYKPELVERTINVLLEAGNPVLLNEYLIQDLEDRVYVDGFDKNDAKDFHNVQTYFKKFFENTVPFIDNPNGQIDFYSLYKSYEVVPYRYKIDYKNNLESKQYFEAMGYITSISDGLFNKFKNKIEEEDGTYYIDTYYDDRLGLTFHEDIGF